VKDDRGVEATRLGEDQFPGHAEFPVLD
jgi:hypothetical protein